MITTTNEIDLTAYKRRFLKVASQSTRGSFQIDDRNREIIRSLFLYFLGQPGPLDEFTFTGFLPAFFATETKYFQTITQSVNR